MMTNTQLTETKYQTYTSAVRETSMESNSSRSISASYSADLIGKIQVGFKRSDRMWIRRNRVLKSLTLCDHFKMNSRDNRTLVTHHSAIVSVNPTWVCSNHCLVDLSWGTAGSAVLPFVLICASVTDSVV